MQGVVYYDSPDVHSIISPSRGGYGYWEPKVLETCEHFSRISNWRKWCGHCQWIWKGLSIQHLVKMCMWKESVQSDRSCKHFASSTTVMSINHDSEWLSYLLDEIKYTVLDDVGHEFSLSDSFDSLVQNEVENYILASSLRSNFVKAWSLALLWASFLKHV